MPSSSPELQAKFMTKNDPGGVVTAENIITSAGGSITPHGFIVVPKRLRNKSEDKQFWDAVQFLCEEWDYALK